MQKTIQLPPDLVTKIHSGYISARDVMRHLSDKENEFEFPANKTVDDTALQDLKIQGEPVIKCVIDRVTGEMHFTTQATTEETFLDRSMRETGDYDEAPGPWDE
jgi:hypothetical protein